MSKSISILDKDYLQWVKELSIRYRRSQIKAAIKVNSVLIEFYWSLGSDIIALGADNKYGGRFYATLSADLRKEMPGIEGLSETNIRYAKRFFQLYTDYSRNLPQLVEELCSIPWGHHRYALESSSQPIGISEYELSKLYPAEVEGTMPSIKEIETRLSDR